MRDHSPDVRRMRLDRGSVQSLLDRLDSAASRFGGGDQALNRKSTRWAFRASTAVLMLAGSHGDWRASTVATRNLSTRGIGLLHDGFIHSGTACMVGLRSLTGVPKTLRGTVVRCRHLSGTAHEVGVSFDESIDPGKFVFLPEITTLHAEHVEPGSLSGRVMIVDSGTRETQQVRRSLRETSVSLEAFEGLDAALKRDLDAFGVALVSQECEPRSGIELIEPLRDGGLACPLVIISSDRDPELPHLCARAGADFFLEMPANRKTVLRMFAEFLAPESTRSRTIGPRADLSSSALDPAFFRRSVSEVRDVGTRIDALLSRGELRSLRETAETLHRVSGHIGLTKITELSEDVLALLDDPRASKAVVRDFAMRLSRACARTRAAA